MAWWPFGKKDKKGGRGRSRSTKSLDKAPAADTQSNPQSRGSGTAGTGTNNAGAITAIQKSYTAPVTTRNSMDRAADEAEDLPASPPRESYEEITALPGAPQHHEFDSGPHLRSIEQLRKSASKSRRGPMDLATLKPKKSTRKKDDDRGRGVGLRSMTQPIPIPESRTASIRPRSSKRSLGRPGTNHGESVVSLPRAASILSAATSKHEYHRFDVGIIDVFSARPKIRHSLQQPSSALPSRAPSRRTTRSFSRPASRAHEDDDDLSMIDDLADEYDATAIRALMERDKRRVMRKVEAQEEKARRRLERRARRDREAAGITNDPGEESSRGALHGLGLENVAGGPSSPVAARQRPQKTEQSEDKAENVGETPVDSSATANATVTASAAEPAAGQAEAGAAEGVTKDATAAVETTAPSPPSPSPVLPVSVPAAAKQDQGVSETQDADQNVDAVAESPTAESSIVGPSRRASVLSTKRGSAIASLFRKSKRNSLVDSPATEQQGTFANTSREADSRQPVPAHLREQPSLTGALSSMVPKRALSKFREHLHESQPREAPAGDKAERIEESQVDDTVAGVPLSTSLASIDSEGSWLSGSRPPRKRESRGTVATPVPVDERPETSDSDDIWVDAQPNVIRQSMRPVEAPIEEVATTTAATTPQHEDEDISESQLRAGKVAQKPVLMQRGNSARSREGLLTSVANQDAASSAQVTDSGSATPGEHSDGMSSPSEGGEATARFEEITQFRSVTHARTVSSGSAKLLDIPARSNSQRRPDQDASA